jgi:hypothetical protein
MKLAAMNLRIHRRTGGSVLLAAMLTVTVVGLALGSYLWLVAHQNLSTMRSLAWNSAIPVVEAGVEEALTQLYHNDIDHLSANGWTNLANGWYYKRRGVDNRSYFEVMIEHADPPRIVSTGYVPAPLAPSSLFGALLGNAGAPPPDAYIRRRVRVNTAHNPLFHGAMIATTKIDMSGNNISTDGFDSGDPQYSTNGKWDVTKPTKASGDVGTNLGLTDSIDVANANIKGHVGTGPGGSIAIGPNGTVGDVAWVDGGKIGIEDGWSTDDVHIEVFDVAQPFTNNYSVPASGTVNNVNYDFVLDQSQNYLVPDFHGKVLVSANATLWVTDTLRFINPSDYIYIAPGASLKLYVSAPSAAIGGSGIMNSDSYATTFQYYGLPSNTSLDFQANAAFTGTIYAPEANFTLGGGGNETYDFVGACVVRTVKLNGHYHFHFDEAIRRSLWKGYLVTAWNEIDPNSPIN